MVFRRGPTRQVELLRWNLENDTLEPGQWLKGRIYERRSDLSPSGRFLVYFAAKYETELRTWTAVSRPPFLTALAFWPKGDAWGGGGLFDSERAIRLNHRPNEMAMAKEFRLAPSMRVDPLGEAPGWGEDDPIHHVRLTRDGWTYLQRPTEAQQKVTKGRWITFKPPIVYTRPVGTGDAIAKLQMSVEGLNEEDGPWYLMRYRLVKDGKVLRDLGRADWADRAPNGDLLLAVHGKLLRASAESVDAWTDVELREVADLTAHTFAPREAPPEARTWVSGGEPAGRPPGRAPRPAVAERRPGTSRRSG